MNENSQKGELKAPCVNYLKLKCSVPCKPRVWNNPRLGPQRGERNQIRFVW